MAWHPEKKFLTAGWENGEIYSWMIGNREFSLVNGPHKSPIVILIFSEKGGRMVSVDSVISLLNLFRSIDYDLCIFK